MASGHMELLDVLNRICGMNVSPGSDMDAGSRMFAGELRRRFLSEPSPHLANIKAATRALDGVVRKQPGFTITGPAASMGVQPASDYWVGHITGPTTSPPEPERRFPDYKDGIESERIRTRGVLEALAPRSTRIQRGMAESWKAEGAREQYDKMMKALQD